MKNLSYLLICFIFFGCGALKNNKGLRTQGDPQDAQSYGYQPIDPLPVQFFHTNGITGLPTIIDINQVPERNEKVLQTLHDETMRLAIRELDGKFNGSFSSAKLGYENRTYEIILDYIKFDTKSLLVKITKENKNNEDKPRSKSRKKGYTDSNDFIGLDYIIGSKPNHNRDEEESSELQARPANTDVTTSVIVPVYVGVGLRFSATVKVNKGNVDLGNLFALGLAGEANKVTGTAESHYW
ncbi:hypothetical protein [Emticicia sp. 21SJ11W-3]|uniref:hypothetical protein n=1 Tax=Emticicia sp. 21SJ11W-3 TaxID=2916755 RepID=UPI0020A1420B|nr:hypothetical protein [Emticicia sp. 21SJ11W-3]UTA68487.1 hypothetical protein MB380_01465 [Emticicia sp. 21SJ11W-3]